MNINWRNQWTPLHNASYCGQVEVVKLLLAHPNIDVNVKHESGQTPFSLVCQKDKVSVVQVLLKDPRVDITLDDNFGGTPLWHASRNECPEVIEWLIASGRDLGDVKNRRAKWYGKDYTALEVARKYEKTEVVSLLEKFLTNPAQTRHEIRVNLKFSDTEVFALTVFLCDDLLQLKPDSHLAAILDHAAAATATLFFTIAKRLPMELQMILCHRVVGSMKQNILRKDSEAAFKSLARLFCLLSSSQSSN